MPTTPIYTLRYPASTDPADVPTDMSELATDVESAINAKGHGVELAYAQFTAPVNITATVEASATTIVTAPAVTLDGSTIILVEFFSPAATAALVANGELDFVLFDGSTSLGYIGTVISQAAFNGHVPVFLSRRLTPSAGSHTYSFRAIQANGTAIVSAGSGGTGLTVPGYIRVIRA